MRKQSDGFQRPMCIVDGCHRLSTTITKRSTCGTHERRMRRLGSLDIVRRANGSGSINASGYVEVCVEGRRTYEHILVAEQALGKPLPPGAVVHHTNENKSDNRPENLVVCPDEAYHRLLHMRMEALSACGNPDWRRCWVCKAWGPPDEVVRRPSGKRQHQHTACVKEYDRRRRKAQES